jgi:hypothetical protein
MNDTVIIDYPDTVQSSDILLGWNDCSDYISQISAKPISAKSIQIYVKNRRIPVFMKKGINTIFLKSQIRHWNSLGRPNMAQYESEKV